MACADETISFMCVFSVAVALMTDQIPCFLLLLICIQIQDPATAYLFRDRAYQHLSIAPVPVPKRATHAVLFWVRKAFGRAFANLKDMLAIVEKYGLQYG